MARRAPAAGWAVDPARPRGRGLGRAQGREAPRTVTRFFFPVLTHDVGAFSYLLLLAWSSPTVFVRSWMASGLAEPAWPPRWSRPVPPQDRPATSSSQFWARGSNELQRAHGPPALLVGPPAHSCLPVGPGHLGGADSWGRASLPRAGPGQPWPPAPCPWAPDPTATAPASPHPRASGPGGRGPPGPTLPGRGTEARQASVFCDVHSLCPRAPQSCSSTPAPVTLKGQFTQSDQSCWTQGASPFRPGDAVVGDV